MIWFDRGFIIAGCDSINTNSIERRWAKVEGIINYAQYQSNEMKHENCLDQAQHTPKFIHYIQNDHMPTKWYQQNLSNLSNALTNIFALSPYMYSLFI